MPKQQSPTPQGDAATTSGGRHHERPGAVHVGCLIDILPAEPDLPRVHTAHDGSQNQAVAS